jgi:hypothetical protein
MMLFAGLVFAGLLVLAACATRVYVAVRALGRQIKATRESLEPRRAALADEAGRLDRARE